MSSFQYDAIKEIDRLDGAIKHLHKLIEALDNRLRVREELAPLAPIVDGQPQEEREEVVKVLMKMLTTYLDVLAHEKGE